LGTIVLLSGFWTLGIALGAIPLVAFANWGAAAAEGTWFEPLSWMALSFLAAWWAFVLWLAMLGQTDRLLSFEYPEWRDLFRGIGEIMVASVGSFLLLGIVGGVLVFNLAIYPIMFSEAPVLKAIGQTLTSWMLLLLGMAQVHFIPILVHQKKPVWISIKRAIVLALLHPFRTILVLVMQGLLFVGSMIPPFGFLLPGLAAFLGVLSLLLLLDEWRDPYEKTAEAGSVDR
jgi:uncharacterized membrane protein YesL